MTQPRKKNDACIYSFILVIAALLIYWIWKFFQQPDAVSRLIYNLIALAEIIAAFIVIAALLLFISYHLSNLKEPIRDLAIQLYDRHMIAKLKPWVNQNRAAEPFLSKPVLLSLAGKKGYRTNNVVVGDPLAGNPSFPTELLDPHYNPPEWEAVEECMQAYYLHFNELTRPKILPAEEVKKRIDHLTLEFYKIHPFADGNKRLAAALGEMIAMKYGYTITNKREVRLYVQNAVISGRVPAQGAAMIKQITH